METLEIRPAKALLRLRARLSLIPGLVAGIILASIFARLKLPVLLGFAIPCIAISAILAAYAAAHFRSISYEVDDLRITSAEGVFWKVRRTTPLDKVTNVDARQGPLERVFGIGQVWVFTPSTGVLTPETQLFGIENPYELKSLILARCEAAKRGTTETLPNASKANPDESLSVLREIAASLKRIESALSERR